MISSLIVFIRMFVDLFSKVISFYSQQFWLTRFFKDMIKSILLNGDISWLDLLVIFIFQLILQLGFLKINGQISIDKFMVFQLYQFLQVLFFNFRVWKDFHGTFRWLQNHLWFFNSINRTNSSFQWNFKWILKDLNFKDY